MSAITSVAYPVMVVAATSPTAPASSASASKKPSFRRAKLKCSHEATRCTNGVYWMIDGEHYCRKHFDKFWESGDEDVTRHRVVRLGGLEWG